MFSACLMLYSPGAVSAGGHRLLPVVIDGKGGYFDRQGAILIPLRFGYAGDFSEGLAPVSLPSTVSRTALYNS
jgi:hypothetical protein